MFINDLLTEDMHYIFSPLSLFNSEWRWDDQKFSTLPKDKFIIANCSSENWGTESFVESLYYKFKEFNLNFLILSHNPTDHLIYPEILFYHYWYYDSIKSFDESLFDITAISSKKTYNLSCLNGCPRPHRIINYFKLLDKNYSNTYISMHSVDEGVTKRDDDCQLDTKFLKEWMDIASQFKNRSTIRSQAPNNEAYMDTYVNLVTETTVSNKLFITEKTWKPIASGQLFLILGNPGSIKFLREQGVDTFDDYIDHSYDSEYDFVIRLDKLYQSLDKLMLSDLEYIHTQTIQRRMKNVKLFFSGGFDLRYIKNLLDYVR